MDYSKNFDMDIYLQGHKEPDYKDLSALIKNEQREKAIFDLKRQLKKIVQKKYKSDNDKVWRTREVFEVLQTAGKYQVYFEIEEEILETLSNICS